LQHDGHVGSVEQPNWVAAAHATLLCRFDWNLNTEALEIDDGGEDCEGGEEVHDVWQILAEKSLAKRELLVWPGE
jgi:hypothetical protein